MPLYVRAGIRMLFGDRSRISGAMLNSKWVEHVRERRQWPLAGCGCNCLKQADPESVVLRSFGGNPFLKVN